MEVLVQVPVAKELDECLQLAVKLVATVKRKEDYTTVVAAFMKAVDGIGGVGEELRAQLPQVINAAAVRMAELVNVLLEPPKVVPVPQS